MVIEVPGQGNIEVPDSWSKDAVRAYVKNLMPQPPPAPVPMGPPKGPITKFLGVDPASVAAPPSLAAPFGPFTKLLGPLGSHLLARAGIMAGTQGLEALSEGSPLRSIPEKMMKGGLMQSAADLTLGGPLRGVLNYQAARAATRNAAPLTAHNKAMTETLNKMEGENFARDTEAVKGRNLKSVEDTKAAHAEATAAEIMDNYKQRVPVFQEFASTIAGLRSTVFGKGPKLLHDRYETAMREAKARGELMDLQVPRRVAEDLDIPIKGDAGKVDAAPPTGPLAPEMAVVNASDAIEAMTGKWGPKTRKSYRWMANELDRNNVGDPMAREEYRNGVSLFDFIDKTKAFDGDVFRPKQIEKGLTSTKHVDILRKRGVGDADTSPFDRARHSPLAPQEPLPDAPPTRVWVGEPKPNIGEFNIPLHLGLGHFLGLTGGGFAGTGARVPIVYRAPITEQAQAVASRIPSLLGVIAGESME